MTKLTNKERKLLNTLTLLRTLFITIGISGFCIMLYTTCSFDNNGMTFRTCCVYMAFGIIIIGGAFAFYKYTTKTYNDICFYLGLYDNISFIKEAKELDPDLYEKYIIDLTGHSPYEEPIETPKPNRTFYNIDLRKIYGNETIIPIAENNLKVIPIKKK